MDILDYKTFMGQCLPIYGQSLFLSPISRCNLFSPLALARPFLLTISFTSRLDGAGINLRKTPVHVTCVNSAIHLLTHKKVFSLTYTECTQCIELDFTFAHWIVVRNLLCDQQGSISAQFDS